MSTLLHRSRALALAALVLAAACTDRGPTEVAPPAGQQVETQITCTASVRDQQVRCGDPASTRGSADIILGGQGTYLRLQSDNVSYDGATGVFSLDVTVQNLLPQPMGTPDGTTVTGVKIFFAQEPAATVGSGEVTIANADGTGQFTRAGQPYFDYAQMLQPRGASRPRTWRFNAPATVERFTFTVYVQTQLPAEQGVLRWRNEGGAAYAARSTDLYAVWMGGPNDVFVGGRNEIHHWDGNDWTALRFETGSNGNFIRDFAGSSRNQLYAGGANGSLFRYDGNQWSVAPGFDNLFLVGSIEGLWADGDTVVAVGWGAEWQQPYYGKVFRSTNAGQTATLDSYQGPTGTRQLWDISGTSTANLWAVGFDELPTATGRVEAVVMHSTNGGATWTDQVHRDDQHRYYGGVWAGPGRVVVGGGHRHPTTNRWEALIMESTDGGKTWTETWFAVSGQNRYIREVWGSPDGTLHAVGDAGGTFINTGSGWTEVPRLHTSQMWGLHGAGSEAYAVALDGSVQRYRSGAWERLDLRAGATGTLRSVWGAGADDVYAVGHAPGPNGAEQSLLMHNQGAGWSVLGTPSDSTEYVDVWGTSGSNVYVVGRRLTATGSTGMIWRFDGTAWTATATPFAGPERQLTAVWGSGPGDVWVLGRQSGPAGDEVVMLRSTNGGASWTESTMFSGANAPATVADVWGSGPSDIYAVGFLTDAATRQPRSLVLRYNGTGWSASNQADGVRLTGVWGSGAGNVYVTGYRTETNVPNTERGLIRRSVNGGATWTEQQVTGTSFQHRGLRGIWGSSANDIYAVGAGPVMHFNGTAWSEQGSQSWPVLRGVWGSSATDVFAVGEKGVILHGMR